MDKVINGIFEAEIERVNNSFPTVYSLADVVTVLSELRMNIISLDFVTTSNEGERNEKISETKRRLRSWFDCNEIVDTSSAEFSIGYKNQIELEHIDLDHESIIDELGDILLDLF